jgi:hypothetical protein
MRELRRMKNGRNGLRGSREAVEGEGKLSLLSHRSGTAD